MTSGWTGKAPSAVTVLLGAGDGSFGAPKTTSLGTGAGSTSGVVLADMNGDGKVDAVVTYFTSDANIAVLLGQGDGTFGPPLARSLGVVPTYAQLGVGDFNGDGAQDVVTAGPGGLVLLEGKGDGTLLAPSAVGSEPRAESFAVADFDRGQPLRLRDRGRLQGPRLSRSRGRDLRGARRRALGGLHGDRDRRRRGRGDRSVVPTATGRS